MFDEKTNAELAKLTMEIATNPKTRRQYVKLAQEIDPSRRFPDVETDDLKDTIQAEFAKRDQAAEVAKVLAVQESQRNSLIASGRYKDEDVKKIEDVMSKYGLSDYEAGAKLYAADHTPARPTSELKTRTWQMPQMKPEDIGNLKQYSLNNAYAVVDELRGRRTTH